MDRKKYDVLDYTDDVNEIAPLLSYHPQYVRILARKGELPAIKRRGKWVFCRQQILDKIRNDLEFEQKNLDERHTSHDNKEGPVR